MNNEKEVLITDLPSNNIDINSIDDCLVGNVYGITSKIPIKQLVLSIVNKVKLTGGDGITISDDNVISVNYPNGDEVDY